MGLLVVLGLGNPGAEYEGTRHNVGFMVVNLLGTRVGVRFRRYDECVAAETAVGGTRLLLVRPMTFMNNSGIAAARFEAILRTGPESFLIVLDDVALPLGTLRLRAGGSDGGHNGLRSVITMLGTEEVPRLRCGIGPERKPAANDLSDFVLSPFENGETEIVQGMVERAADAVLSVARLGVAQAMNVVNA